MIIVRRGVDLQLDWEELKTLGKLASRIIDQYENDKFVLNTDEAKLIQEFKELVYLH